MNYNSDRAIYMCLIEEIWWQSEPPLRPWSRKEPHLSEPIYQAIATERSISEQGFLVACQQVILHLTYFLAPHK